MRISSDAEGARTATSIGDCSSCRRRAGRRTWSRRTVKRVLFAVFFLVSGTASAQWVNLKQPGIPRTADGKPNLSAPAPRGADSRPDLSGLWHNGQNGLANDLTSGGAQVSFTPEGAAIYKRRQETDAKGRPSELCLPHGIPDAMMVGVPPFKIVQNPGVTMILYEFQNRYRQIFTDGRGHPHSEALHVTEKFHRRDFGHLDFQITIDDSKMYTKPWTVSSTFELFPDNE